MPRSPSEIGPAWLNAVLCRDTPGAQVRAVTTVGASAGTTTRRAIEVTYNEAGFDAGLPTRLFLKGTVTLAQRLMLGLGGFIAGEPGFYVHVRPELEIEAPAGYFGAVEPHSWRSLVVMDDVTATRGAHFWQPSHRVTRAEIEDLLRTVATWHGALWDSPRLTGWRWLRTPAAQMDLIDSLIGLADRRAIGAERARAVIPHPLRGRQADLYAGMRRSMHIASRGPQTYVHGDLHVANTYRTALGRIGVSDWQTSLRGSWALDYAYLLATALTVGDRRAWEGELLDLYLDKLSAAGGAAIPRAEAWLAYRQATFYPYFAWIYTIGRSRLQPSFQPDAVSLTMVERIGATIDDLDSLGAVGL